MSQGGYKTDTRRIQDGYMKDTDGYMKDTDGYMKDTGWIHEGYKKGIE